MQFKKLFFVALAIFATSALLLPLTASAAGWSAPFALSSGNIKPAVAVGTDGSVHYVWYNVDNIQYVKCTGLAKNTCGNIQNLPVPDKSYYPSIALDSQNRPNVVWESKDSSSGYAIYFSRKGGTKWSSPKRISTQSYSELPDIAIAPDDSVHIIYQSKSGQTGYVYYARGTSALNFSAPEELESVQTQVELPVLAEVGLLGMNAETTDSTKLSQGFYPRIAADNNGDAHAVWQKPAPGYGIAYRHQVGGAWSGINTLNTNKKDETPDVTVNKDNITGIVWARYANDAIDVSLAEFDSGSQDFSQTNVDGGLDQSLWPKIAADCNGTFHFAYQGRSSSGNWNIYHTTYDPGSNQVGGRDTIATSNYTEQTPAIAVTSVAAVAYTNSSVSIIDASTNNLNLSCSTGPTNTPTATNTTDPNITPTPTNTPPTPGGEIWIPNTSSDIIYRKTWKTISNSKATDGNYSRCENGGVCVKASAAKVVVPDGFTKVEWYTAKSSAYGIARIWINADQVTDPKPFGSVDLCQGNNGVAPKFVKLTYNIPPGNGNGPRTFEIGTRGQHSSCSPYNSNYVIVDGFKLLP